MFIVEPVKKEDAEGELKVLYSMIERSLGFVPRHFELFAAMDANGLKEFVEFNRYFMTHEKIDAKLLPYLRLYIANKECRNYCSSFNSALLLNMGEDERVVKNIEQNLDALPFDDKQKTLFIKILKALYETEQFGRGDLDELYEVGFSDKDFFDLLNYITQFMAKSKMIEVYLK